MLTIVKGQNNTLYFLLKDKGYSDSSYLLTFHNLITKIDTTITIVDTAPSASKYTTCIFNEPSNAALTAGSYSYSIKNLSSVILDEGLLLVVNATSAEVPQFENKQTYAEYN